uniref:non-specific serine/threonine protein kinase n=1 Tax=Trypanosoma congolense (strain IL3000) TaxID=1068625 RepID=G0UK64_TRYCI|nr:putative serine/threonine-protein kinase Nek1 [Trypanosoma congolense IL3000]
MRPRDTSAQELKRYVIEKALCLGGGTDVFKVREVSTDKPYVLKQMSLVSMGAEERKRVLKEIYVMSDVNHPNVVKFRESFSGNSSVNIIMEYCKCSLEELIVLQQEEGFPFPEEVIIEWMVELLSGLAYLHSRRIIHRDIKTSNIFVTEKNHLKLGDFGVCTVLTKTSVAASSMVGTPLYFSPEVCGGEAYDMRSDVWSLGVVFYEMCTLRRPFDAKHLSGLMHQILTQDVAPFDTGLDSRLEEIVLRMLCKEPRDRPTSQDLIDNHLVVPCSHPSHSTQRPSHGRLIQRYYGPELFFSCDAAPSWGNGGLDESKVGPSQAKPTYRKKVEQVQQPPLRIKSVPPAATRVPLHEPASVRKNFFPQKPPVACDRGRELSAQERAEAMERIKCAKSRINMAELRRSMQQRRLELLGAEGANVTDDIPIVIELKSEKQQQSQKLQDNETDAAQEKPRPSQHCPSFLDDIAAVVERHSSGGVKIELDQLDAAASLLCQYKVTNHGIY